MFVGVSQAARMLGVSRQRVQFLVSQGRIPAQRLDGSNIWLIESKDLTKFMKRRSTIV
jgi:excisionase family DNA binding protein